MNRMGWLVGAVSLSLLRACGRRRRSRGVSGGLIPGYGCVGYRSCDWNLDRRGEGPDRALSKDGGVSPFPPSLPLLLLTHTTQTQDPRRLQAPARPCRRPSSSSPPLQPIHLARPTLRQFLGAETYPSRSRSGNEHEPSNPGYALRFYFASTRCADAAYPRRFALGFGRHQSAGLDLQVCCSGSFSPLPSLSLLLSLSALTRPSRPPLLPLPRRSPRQSPTTQPPYSQ